MKISQSKKDTGVYCCAYGCKEKPNKKKAGLCHKHYARKRREVDPVAVRYNQWKQSAKQRGKAFSVTLEQFRQFCRDTGYIVNKGRRGMSATLDRVINSEGYHIDNLQLLTNRANASKGANDARCPF
ncbi:hypothetical protein SAMN05192545_3954 [Maribacter dokdonensis]|uniref:HNH endonuclease n=1 Tax=Maribacter dokdonensis TaxID=320912 RepID=A0ABY0V0H4_9FLAO|nr:hypothetical protein [Maribacter dokdonensis]SDT46632.1 hypothetical protein SAMN05192545_3902 [Maribacter dokdonensis]SDT47917.1 hypothetical protein SAMN05192545_3954 [Maribacter dokdonensis]